MPYACYACGHRGGVNSVWRLCTACLTLTEHDYVRMTDGRTISSREWKQRSRWRGKTFHKSKAR
jgi:spore cortex formation protein SpoVR/YcgB (stage V sporulation)